MAEEVKAKHFSFGRTIINVSSQWIRLAATIVINLLLTAYVISQVGKVAYGSWSGALEFAAFLMLLDSGLGLAVQQRVAHYSRGHDADGFRRVFSVSLPIYFGMACIAAGLGVVVSNNYGALFPKVPPETVVALIPAIRWAACGVAAGLFSVPARGALLGMQRFELSNIITVLSHIARAVVIVFCFNQYGPKLEFLGLAMFASGLVQMLGNHICLQLMYRDFRLTFSGWSGEFHQLFKFSYHAVFWSICQMAMYRSGPILALRFFGPEAATYVYLCSLLIQSLRGIVVTGAMVALPIAASIHTDKLKPLMLRGTRISGCLAMVAGGGLMGFASSLFFVWQGPGFEECVWILAAGLAGSVLVWTSNLVSATIVGRKMLADNSRITGLRAAATFICGLGGAYLFDTIGLVGGMALGNGLASILLYPQVAAKHFGVSRVSLFRSVFPTQVLLGLFALAAGLIITWIYSPQSWLELVIEVGIVALILVPLLWFWGIDEGVRSVVRTKIFARIIRRP